MDSVSLNNITDGTVFHSKVMLDEDFLILPEDCYFTEEILKSLKEWDFKEVFVDKSNSSQETAVPEQQPAQEEAPAATSSEDTQSVDVSEFMEEEEDKPLPSNRPVPQVQETEDTPAEEPAPVEEEKKQTQITDEDYAKAQETYMQFMAYINTVYTKYATTETFNKEELTEEVKKLCAFIKENKHYVLRIISTPGIASDNFLVNHSMRCTVVSVAIALQLKFPDDKLWDLALASILHEIGMILLPPQLYMTDKQLTKPERLMMNTHPVVSYNILRKAEFPQLIQLAALQHHEKVNGSGYPKHFTGENIHIYSKIISLACSFEAITSPRSYKEDRSTFEALIELVRNTTKQYDDTVTKALLYSVSLYPIGVYVYLSNGKVAQVVDVTEGDPRAPFVQIVGENDENGNQKIVQVDLTRTRIMRVMNKQEVKDTLATLKRIGK